MRYTSFFVVILLLLSHGTSSFALYNPFDFSTPDVISTQLNDKINDMVRAMLLCHNDTPEHHRQDYERLLRRYWEKQARNAVTQKREDWLYKKMNDTLGYFIAKYNDGCGKGYG